MHDETPPTNAPRRAAPALIKAVRTEKRLSRLLGCAEFGRFFALRWLLLVHSHPAILDCPDGVGTELAFDYLISEGASTSPRASASIKTIADSATHVNSEQLALRLPKGTALTLN